MANTVIMEAVFFESHATKGYARRQEDGNRYNESINKLVISSFIVKNQAPIVAIVREQAAKAPFIMIK